MPILPSGPWPGRITVSGGSVNSLARTADTSRVRCAGGRPRPAPSAASESPVNTEPSVSAYQHIPPSVWPGTWIPTSRAVPTSNVMPSISTPSGQRVGKTSRHGP